MSRIVCVAVLSAWLLTTAGSAEAGMNEGIAAVTVGDYAKAMSEFEPLAASGDAAAQYQLAKIYLEGHGPVDGVPRGIELMTSAANGSYPEAQAQLGLMYAMGLGVPVDNAKAYDWLNKAVTALPDGTRRTVAEANRDAVLKRMNGGKMPAVAAAPAATATTKTQEASAKSATNTTTTGATTTKTTTPVTTSAKPIVTETSASKTVTNTAAKPAATATTTSTTTKPAASTSANSTTAATTAKPAASTTATTTKPAASTTSTAVTTQVASAKAPDPATGAAAAAPTGVRIQLASLPSEELAWKAWKDLNNKYSAQLSDLKADVQPADLGTKGTFYRVYTGPFDTVAKAQERCTAMKTAGLDCLVIGKP